MDDFHRHPVMADAEIPPRPLGLRAPVAVGGHLDRTEAVGLGARRTGLRGYLRSGHGSCPLREASASRGPILALVHSTGSRRFAARIISCGNDPAARPRRPRSVLP